MVKIIIAGGRDFVNYTLLKLKMDAITSGLRKSNTPIQVVSGKAKGADALGEKWAKHHSITIKEFYADWDLNGNAAGPIRNTEMANYATHLVAFWDGKSRGTLDMINAAKACDLKIRIIKYA